MPSRLRYSWSYGEVESLSLQPSGGALNDYLLIGIRVYAQSRLSVGKFRLNFSDTGLLLAFIDVYSCQQPHRLVFLFAGGAVRRLNWKLVVAIKHLLVGTASYCLCIKEKWPLSAVCWQS